MATVTVFTAERMQEIEDQVVVNGEIVNGNLILTQHNGTLIDAGPVAGYFATVVDHGAVASTARPTGALLVIWRGTVEPTNMIAGDLFMDLS